MSEDLPPIDIAVPCPPAGFLDAIETIAGHAQFKIERRTDRFGAEDFDILNLRFDGETPHRALGAQLISRTELKGRVAVEVRAQRWAPHDPTYKTYVDAAKGLLSPLLSEYNRQNGTRLRLRIPTQKQMVPRLTERSAQLFNRFVTLANKSALHPLDWERFYEFVAGSRGRRLDEVQMSRLLVDRGFSREYAEHIASIYEHLVDFKALCCGR